MAITTTCPTCQTEFETEKDIGACPACQEPYFLDEACTDDYSDCWTYVYWQNYERGIKVRNEQQSN